MMPPSSEALRHSGGARRRRTSATLTLYFELEASSESRPGTLQKRSDGCRPLGSSASLSSHSDLTPAGTHRAQRAVRQSTGSRAERPMQIDGERAGLMVMVGCLDR